MRADEFCRWLQGFFEIEGAGRAGPPTLTPAQLQVVKDHLQLVFTKATPRRDGVTAGWVEGDVVAYPHASPLDTGASTSCPPISVHGADNLPGDLAKLVLCCRGLTDVKLC